MVQRRLTALIESRYDARGTDQAARDMKNLGTTGGQAAQGVGKMSKAAGGLLSSFGGLVAGGILLAAGRQVVQFGAAAIAASSREEEMSSKFSVVFGEAAPRASKALEEFGAAVNRSRYDLQEMSASLQDTFVPLGFARTEASKMSVALVRLATDVASFNNAADITV